jgi:ABC-type lipoprotein export system ATPase subunit
MSNDGRALIQIQDLTKVFYTDEIETHALSGVHLEIEKGEYVAMSGPSGCGKSTLLSIIGLLDMPTAGKYHRGQQQRVAVARALAGNPSILLADEPTGNLDSRNGEAVMELLQNLHREGATICMVTHDPRFAAHAQRQIHLFDGKVVAEEDLQKLTQEIH